MSLFRGLLVVENSATTESPALAELSGDECGEVFTMLHDTFHPASLLIETPDCGEALSVEVLWVSCGNPGSRDQAPQNLE